MITLRPALSQDNKFLESVYGSTREKELALTNWTLEQKNAFIHMQSTLQLAEYSLKYPNGKMQIIMYKKKNGGRLYTNENEDCIHIIDITILPHFQSKGIGTFLINNLIKISEELKKKITLFVYQTNPAIQLYFRLGFKKSYNEGMYVFMERIPIKKV